MSKKLQFFFLFLIFINGYVSLSLELISLRQVSSFVGSTAVTASIIIGVFLAFMSWGYYYGSVISLLKNKSRKLLYINFIIIAIMIVLAGSFSVVEINFSAMNEAGLSSNILKTFIYSFLFLSVGPFLFGLNTALICRYLHKYNRDYTGKIMAIDTIGSVLGSLLTTLVLMPLIGVNHTLVLVVGFSLFGAFLVLPRKKDLVVFPLLICITYLINSDYALYTRHKIVENNAVSTISILEEDGGKSKIMLMNGSPASKTSEDKNLHFEYVKYIEENFINNLPKNEKKDVLVLGAGGFTMGEDDLFHNYTYIDIDKSLKDVSEKYFLNKKVSPNKIFVVEDANQFLKDDTKKYDLIILDVYSSLHFIPQDLITKEYFERVKANLKEGGIMLLNAIVSPSFSNEYSMKLDNTIRYVFGHNLQRQTICKSFNPWQKDKTCNIVYVYYNKKNNANIYTTNKNTLIYDM
ncbi:MAG: fused MFS/spermidine synthase [Alphaproteobacteria bacterium]